MYDFIGVYRCVNSSTSLRSRIKSERFLYQVCKSKTELTHLKACTKLHLIKGNFLHKKYVSS